MIRALWRRWQQSGYRGAFAVPFGMGITWLAMRWNDPTFPVQAFVHGVTERAAHVSMVLIILIIVAVLVLVVFAIGLIWAEQERQREEIRRMIERGKDYDEQTEIPPTPRNA